MIVLNLIKLSVIIALFFYIVLLILFGIYLVLDSWEDVKEKRERGMK